MLMRKMENEKAITLCKLEEAKKKLIVLEEQSLAVADPDIMERGGAYNILS